MAITIQAKPYAKVGPAGQDWNWTLSSNNNGQPKFKYVCDIYIFTGTSPGVNPTVRLKFSPNAFGMGTINLRDHIEQHVGPDNVASIFDGTFFPSYQGREVDPSSEPAMVLHAIDHFSLNNYNFKRMTIKWGEEYAPSVDDPSVVYNNLNIENDYGFWNGVVPYGGQRHAEGRLGQTGGVELQTQMRVYGGPYFPNQGIAYFLTNAPTTQYVRDNDYFTVGMLSGYLNNSSASWDSVEVNNGNINLIFSADTTNANNNGGYDGSNDAGMARASRLLQYFGCGPGNLRQASTTFDTDWNAGHTTYTVRLYNNSTGQYKSRPYTFVRQEDDCKGYETIRLTWLNRHGCWDYYNFTKKSYREVNIDREYTKSNKHNTVLFNSKYPSARINKIFSLKAKEMITANSDWISQEESIWLEELFTSPEVYMLGQRDIYDGIYSNAGNASGRGLITPVQVVSNKYERYTRANDKVAQYEIELELDGNVNVQNTNSVYGHIGY